MNDAAAIETGVNNARTSQVPLESVVVSLPPLRKWQARAADQFTAEGKLSLHNAEIQRVASVRCPLPTKLAAALLQFFVVRL